MIPLSLVSKPVMHLSNVDLPEPDGGGQPRRTGSAVADPAGASCPAAA